MTEGRGAKLFMQLLTH